jgi:hypothetical protein
MQDLRKSLWIGILIIIEVCTFVFSALPNDVRTYYMGLAYSAKYYEGSEFVGVLHNWELKGFLSRYLLWFPHRFASLFFEYQSLGYYRMFAVFYVAVFLITWLLVCIFYYYKKQDMQKALYLCVGGISAVLMTSSAFHMQAEMSVLIILMIASILYYAADKKIEVILAGIMASSIMFIKTNMFCMLLAVLGMALYLSKDMAQVLKKIWPAILASGITILSVISLLWLFYPQEIMDVLITPTMFRTTLGGFGFPIKTFIIRFLLDACYGAPFLIIGICFSAWELICCLKEKKMQSIVGLVFMWFAPFLTIFLSGRTNVYYYGLFLYPSVMVITKRIEQYQKSDACAEESRGFGWKKVVVIIVGGILLYFGLNNDYFYQLFDNQPNAFAIFPIFCVMCAALLALFEKNGSTQKRFDGGILVTSLIIFFAFVSCFSISFWQLKQYEDDNQESAMAFRSGLLEDKEYNQEETVLYLDDGLGLALLGNKSYSRYFFPMPMVKTDCTREDSVFKDEYAKILQYDGEFVLINEAWFYSLYENAAIREKLAQEYEEVASYDKIITSHAVFCRTNDDNKSVVEYKLLKRK